MSETDFNIVRGQLVAPNALGREGYEVASLALARIQARLRNAERRIAQLDAYINLPGGWKERATNAEAKNAVLRAENKVLRDHIDRRHGGGT